MPNPMAAPTPEQDAKTLAQPAREEVEALLRRDALRGFRVDIESDSTIRGDLARNQQNMTSFLQGTGAYMSTIGPGVKEGYVPAEVAVEIYAAFARQFKLGKQAEDALDRLADDAKKQAKQPKPPDPKAEADKLKAQATQAKSQADMAQTQMDMKAAQEQHAADMQAMQAKIALQREEMAIEQQRLANKRADLEVDQQRHAMQMQQRAMPPAVEPSAAPQQLFGGLQG